MKLYVFMTSLALAAGASIGYWTGHGSALTEFAQDCMTDGIAVVYDYQADQHRHFHCFELDDTAKPDPTTTPDSGQTLEI